jgi:hypothetical protein
VESIVQQTEVSLIPSRTRNEKRLLRLATGASANWFVLLLRGFVFLFVPLFFAPVVVHGQVGGCRAYMQRRFGGIDGQILKGGVTIACNPAVEAAEVNLKNTLAVSSCKVGVFADLLNDANQASFLIETDGKFTKKWDHELSKSSSDELGVMKHIVLVQQYLVLLRRMSTATQNLIKDPPKEFCSNMNEQEIAHIKLQRQKLNALLKKHHASLEMLIHAIYQGAPVQVIGLSSVISSPTEAIPK